MKREISIHAIIKSTTGEILDVRLDGRDAYKLKAELDKAETNQFLEVVPLKAKVKLKFRVGIVIGNGEEIELFSQFEESLRLGFSVLSCGELDTNSISPHPNSRELFNQLPVKDIDKIKSTCLNFMKKLNKEERKKRRS